jgi:hypothetical protein
MDLTETSLVKVARHFYPTGYPVTSDEYGKDGLLPYQRTPEYARYLEAWDKAMTWPEWKTLRLEMRSVFPECGDCTQPRGASCRRCCVYLSHPLPHGARHLTIIAAAVSVLAPVYLVYCTTAVVVDKQREDRRVFLEAPEEVKPQAAALSALVERVLGYQPFPLSLATLRVPRLRVPHLYRDEEPTLLDALFDTELDTLF